MLIQSDFYSDLLDNLADGIYFTDMDGRIVYWSKGAEHVSGYNGSEVLGKRCNENILMHIDASGCSLCHDGCPLRAAALKGEVNEADVFLLHKTGARIPIHMRTLPLRDSTGKIIGAVEVFRDNTIHARMAERLAKMEELALLDSLTGLPNRRYLLTQIYAHLEEFRRAGWTFGILFIDIDDFKMINDKYGHDTGDRMLGMVAKTLDANSRFFDAVGRWGGEEFVAIIHNIQFNVLKDIAERFRMLVEQSALNSLHVTISVGGTLAVIEDDPESVVRRADSNLYKAKKAGKNRIHLDLPPPPA
jgi:diguanylate cyclase (GGDEF)-like protein/PAS domain S-box-containing protein